VAAGGTVCVACCARRGDDRRSTYHTFITFALSETSALPLLAPPDPSYGFLSGTVGVAAAATRAAGPEALPAVD